MRHPLSSVSFPPQTEIYRSNDAVEECMENLSHQEEKLQKLLQVTSIMIKTAHAHIAKSLFPFHKEINVNP